MTARACVLVLLVACSPLAWAAEPVVFDMDTLRHKPNEITDKDKKKIPSGTAELVEGKFGKAVKFSFVDGARGGFMVGRVPAGGADWSKFDGFSFWVKGDGSEAWGGIELIDKSDFGLRYASAFPIDSTEWRKIVVPWRDLVPELAGPVVGAKDGYSPGGFGQLWFGKWFHWRDYPAHSYAVDQVMLEEKIELPPTPAAPEGEPLGRVRAKLAAGKPVTIVTMGDSLTDTRHWANRQTVWAGLLADALKTKHKSEVTIVNPAIGGTTLSQGLVTMPRWSKAAPTPDLVVVWFGGNDWGSEVRGPRFGEYLRLAVDRIRRQTNGTADVLLVTTCPSHANWETLKELEQAAREVATEKKTGLADVAAEFRKAGTSPDEALKQGYWVWDKVHLGPRGHELARDVVMKAIGGNDE